MRKLFKNLFLLSLSTAIVLAGLGILVQNYMQSHEFIEKISQSFSTSIHSEFSIASADINLLRGFSLESVLIKSEEENAHPFLTIDNAFLTYNPVALFLKKLELSSIRLEQPTLTFAQAENGDWWLPRPDNDVTHEIDTGLLAFQLLLKDISLREGNVQVTRKDGLSILKSDNITIEGSLKSSELETEAIGDLSIKKTRMGKYFVIEDMESHISYKDEVLSIPNLTGSAYEGKAAGSIEIDLRIGEPEFTIALNLEQLDLAQLISAFQGQSQWLNGKLTTLCRIKGRFEAPELLQGTGTLEITEGTLCGFAFLEELSQLFPKSKFPDTDFDTITGNYKIAEKKLTIYNLEAISQNVQLIGAGTVSVNRELNIDMRLSLSPKFARLLDPEIASQFSLREDKFSTITFTLTGTLDQPQSNLIEKLKQNKELVPQSQTLASP